jgi:hypothetical protein
LTTHGHLLILIGAVSALLPLAAVLLARGIGATDVPLTLGGVILGALGVLGVVLLVRIVVVVERRRFGR